jgi:hypothetical protein
VLWQDKNVSEGRAASIFRVNFNYRNITRRHNPEEFGLKTKHNTFLKMAHDRKPSYRDS